MRAFWLALALVLCVAVSLSAGQSLAPTQAPTGGVAAPSKAPAPAPAAAAPAAASDGADDDDEADDDEGDDDLDDDEVEASPRLAAADVAPTPVDKPPAPANTTATPTPVAPAAPAPTPAPAAAPQQPQIVLVIANQPCDLPRRLSSGCCQGPLDHLTKCCTRKASCSNNQVPVLTIKSDCTPAIRRTRCCRNENDQCCRSNCQKRVLRYTRTECSLRRLSVCCQAKKQKCCRKCTNPVVASTVPKGSLNSFRFAQVDASAEAEVDTEMGSDITADTAKMEAAMDEMMATLEKVDEKDCPVAIRLATCCPVDGPRVKCCSKPCAPATKIGDMQMGQLKPVDTETCSPTLAARTCCQQATNTKCCVECAPKRDLVTADVVQCSTPAASRPCCTVTVSKCCNQCSGSLIETEGRKTEGIRAAARSDTSALSSSNEAVVGSMTTPFAFFPLMNDVAQEEAEEAILLQTESEQVIVPSQPPVLVKPGNLNTTYVNKDNKTMVPVKVMKKCGGACDYAAAFVDVSEEQIVEPYKAPIFVKGGFNMSEPYITPEGKKMVPAKTRKRCGGECNIVFIESESQAKMLVEDNAQQIVEPYKAPIFVKGGFNMSEPHITADGKKMIPAKTRKRCGGECNIVFVESESEMESESEQHVSQIVEPYKAPIFVKGGFNMSEPYITPEGKKMVPAKVRKNCGGECRVVFLEESAESAVQQIVEPYKAPIFVKGGFNMSEPYVTPEGKKMVPAKVRKNCGGECRVVFVEDESQITVHDTQIVEPYKAPIFVKGGFNMSEPYITPEGKKMVPAKVQKKCGGSCVTV